MMSLFPMLASVAKRLDALRRNFIWQGASEERNPSGQMGCPYNKQEGRRDGG